MKYLRIDSPTGVILEVAEQVEYWEAGSMMLSKDGRETFYSPFGIFRVKELTKDEYDSLVEQAQAQVDVVDEDDDEGYDGFDPAKYHQAHVLGGLQ